MAIPESGRGASPDSDLKGKKRITRRTFFLALGVALGGAAGTLRLVDNLNSPPTPETGAQPSSLLRIENGQIIDGKQVIGAAGPNLYSITNIEGCGYPNPVTPLYQRTILQVIRSQGYDTARGWHFQTEGPADASRQSLENLVQVAEELNMRLVLTLAGNDTDGCGQKAKDPSWYAGGYKKDGYLAYLTDVERTLQGTNNVILELHNETGNGADLDPRTVNEFFRTGADAIKSVNPNRLVTGSFLLGNSLTQPSNLKQVLDGKPIDILDLHFYPSCPLPYEAIQIAAAFQMPVFIGEVGVNPKYLGQYLFLFNELRKHPNVFGLFSWGEKIVDPSGNILYQTTDGYGFDPDSETASLFQAFAPIFEHPKPNQQNKHL